MFSEHFNLSNTMTDYFYVFTIPYVMIFIKYFQYTTRKIFYGDIFFQNETTSEEKNITYTFKSDALLTFKNNLI